MYYTKCGFAVPETEVKDASSDVLLDLADCVLELLRYRLTTKRLDVEVVGTSGKYEERDNGDVQPGRLSLYDTRTHRLSACHLTALL